MVSTEGVGVPVDDASVMTNAMPRAREGLEWMDWMDWTRGNFQYRDFLEISVSFHIQFEFDNRTTSRDYQSAQPVLKLSHITSLFLQILTQCLLGPFKRLSLPIFFRKSSLHLQLSEFSKSVLYRRFFLTRPGFGGVVKNRLHIS